MDQNRPLTKTDNFWLAIPLPAAGKSLRGGRITPGEWERRRGMRLRFVYRRSGPSLLVVDKARLNTRGQAIASRSKTGRVQPLRPQRRDEPDLFAAAHLERARDPRRHVDLHRGEDLLRHFDRLGAAATIGAATGTARMIGRSSAPSRTVPLHVDGRTHRCRGFAIGAVAGG
jgi:Family of unknown function (DUF6441)